MVSIASISLTYVKKGTAAGNKRKHLTPDSLPQRSYLDGTSKKPVYAGADDVRPVGEGRLSASQQNRWRSERCRAQVNMQILNADYHVFPNCIVNAAAHCPPGCDRRVARPSSQSGGWVGLCVGVLYAAVGQAAGRVEKRPPRGKPKSAADRSDPILLLHDLFD